MFNILDKKYSATNAARLRQLFEVIQKSAQRGQIGIRHYGGNRRHAGTVRLSLGEGDQ